MYINALYAIADRLLMTFSDKLDPFRPNKMSGLITYKLFDTLMEVLIVLEEKKQQAKQHVKLPSNVELKEAFNFNHIIIHFHLQKGVDRELYVNWLVIDENLSWYIDQNINLFTQAPFTVDKKDRAFKLSNQIRGILFPQPNVTLRICVSIDLS